jgi:hypothetical protein
MLILMGLIGQEGSGSSGSATLSRNRSGHYLRARRNPVNPNTARQQAARLRGTLGTSMLMRCRGQMLSVKRFSLPVLICSFDL